MDFSAIYRNFAKKNHFTFDTDLGHFLSHLTQMAIYRGFKLVFRPSHTAEQTVVDRKGKLNGVSVF